MFRFGRSRLVRTLTLLLLLRVGLDLGAHGLLASDFAPIAPAGSTLRVTGAVEDAAAPCSSPDHCICHGFSTGPAPSISLDVVSVPGLLLAAQAPGAPCSRRYPLDRPPRHAA